MPSRLHRRPSGKVSSKVGTARKLRNEEENEEEEWKNEDQKEVQWAEIMQKVLELVVHERMSQCEKVKGTKENKKVKGRSTEEMKEKSSSSSGGHRRNEEMEVHE